MKPEQLEALLHYRLQQAYETLRESDILLSEKRSTGDSQPCLLCYVLCSIGSFSHPTTWYV